MEFRLILIRHAHAYERHMWEGSDLARPLIPKGEKVAKKSGKRLARFLEQQGERLEAIYASEAVRSYETARIILKSFKDLSCVVSPLVNPDSGCCGYESIFKEAREEGNVIVAIVGHEYDLSKTVSYLCGEGSIRIDWKKAGFLILNLIDDEWFLEVMR